MALPVGSTEDDSDNPTSQQQTSTPSPPPIISTPLAIKYITELQYQASQQTRQATLTQYFHSTI
ncbi:hypothetical protein L873DRAFT_1822301 [Choiromyces venosus 120613-1]|uniref:Uncharacterized protein n=1 Tax=Choiromyces venosus 120613-1 TaxID=1336337 RepID=A0A3N4IU54_9PEZI|nr:hypothetical protein L873DRAFT_1822301 [Choiromyces venosus 120613-1]